MDGLLIRIVIHFAQCVTFRDLISGGAPASNIFAKFPLFPKSRVGKLRIRYHLVIWKFLTRRWPAPGSFPIVYQMNRMRNLSWDLNGTNVSLSKLFYTNQRFYMFSISFASFWNLTSVFQPLKEFILHQKQVSRDLTNWNLPLCWSETSILVQLQLWILWKYCCNIFGNFKIIMFILKYKCIQYGKYIIIIWGIAG